MWSNAAARAGTDPCIGAPTTPYYQTVPDQPDTITVAPFGVSIASKGTKIAVGAAGTITLHVAGTPGSGPFMVTALDVATNYEGAAAPALSFVQPTGTFAIGDTVTIHIMVMAKDAGLGGTGAEAFEIDTTPVGSGPTTYFWGMIGQ